jgi:hypothetical protein
MVWKNKRRAVSDPTFALQPFFPVGIRKTRGIVTATTVLSMENIRILKPAEPKMR